MNEADLYKELGILTKNRDKWEENIAANTPDIYEHYMPVFEKLLIDDVEKKEFLSDLLKAMYDELPAPKKKK